MLCTKLKPVTDLYPVHKVKLINRNGSFVEVVAMLAIDSGSNISLLSKNAARRLGLNGSTTHLTMNLAGGGGEKKNEPSHIIDIALASPTDEGITKTLLVYTVTRPCSNAKKKFKRINVTIHPFDLLNTPI